MKYNNNKEEAIIKINKIFYAKVLETFGFRVLVGVTFVSSTKKKGRCKILIFSKLKSKLS